MRYGIRGIPTLIYFKDGREAGRVVGLTGYSMLSRTSSKSCWIEVLFVTDEPTRHRGDGLRRVYENSSSSVKLNW